MPDQNRPDDLAGITDAPEPGISLMQMLLPLAYSWRLLVIGPVLLAIAAYSAAWLIPPTYTARAVFLPPQQQQSAAASALASLSALSGLANGASGMKNPSDQYVALMQSATVSDRIVKQFDLKKLYEAQYDSDARSQFANNLRIVVGKRDGLINVEFDDASPQRAAEIANGLIDELRSLTNHLSLSEAQQRRSFFEKQLQETRDRLTRAQVALETTGFNAGALRAEPRAAADGYARIKAEVTAAEVRLSTLRSSLADLTPEVRQQAAQLSALRGQLGALETKMEDGRGSPGTNLGDADYIGKYREFKYQETLLDLFARQFEMAKLDESRDGALIQVIDPATPPEKRSKPSRMLIALGAFGMGLLLITAFVLMRSWWHVTLREPTSAAQLLQVRRALRRDR